jgi:hypothetical protein
MCFNLRPDGLGTEAAGFMTQADTLAPRPVKLFKPADDWHKPTDARNKQTASLQNPADDSQKNKQQLQKNKCSFNKANRCA